MTIDEIHAALRRDEKIGPNEALMYAQHHMAIAIADEREACAKAAEPSCALAGLTHDVWQRGFNAGRRDAADKIRARSTPTK